MARGILIIFILLISSTLYGQNISIKGTITDVTKAPVIGASIKATTSNYTFETESDTKGDFQLTIPDSTAELTISKPGYETFNNRVSSNMNMTIDLAYSELTSMSIEEILRTRVNTVSLKEENINDAPGVVSVITGEELRNLGIRTVREALTLVPGFSPFQNDDEQILSVRGVFATTSQKILFMRNGHSLNEGNLDIPQMEFSIAIENVKKIEVIRGPGASIYGNSAFAAVVNIITLDEEEIRAKGCLGTYNYFDGDAYISKKINNNDHVLAWARFVASGGEPINVQYNKYSIDGSFESQKGTYKAYNYPLNYDVGFRYKAKIMNTSVSARRHQYNTYWTIPGEFTNADSLFRQPNLLQNSVHYDLNFNFKVDANKKVILQNYVDYSTLTNFRLTGNISDTTPKGIIQSNEWNVVKTGLNYYGSWQYSKNGSLIAGVAYEFRKYLDSWITSNRNDPSQMSLFQDYYPQTVESRVSGYLQANHALTEWLKFDIGARYDAAEKYKGTFNPRAAIIVQPFEKLFVKAIYTKAFQAPGYSYRNANSNASYSGSLGVLDPEIINTFQGTIRYNMNNTSYFEVAAFYNQLQNMIARRKDSSYYSNFGKLASYGIEFDAHVNIHKHSLFVMYSMLLPDTSYMDNDFKTLYIKDNKFRMLPQHTLNAGVILRFFNKINWSFYSQYTSSCYAANDTKIDSKIILNSTIRIINLHKNLEFGASVYNLANKSYLLGDPSINPLPQAGRWMSMNVVLKF